jgi:hypothetical protein
MVACLPSKHEALSSKRDNEGRKRDRLRLKNYRAKHQASMFIDRRQPSQNKEDFYFTLSTVL